MNNVTTLTGKTSTVRVAAIPQKTARIYLLGTMRATGPRGEDLLPSGKKTQAVLAYLCLARGERLSRARLAGIIWDRSGEAQARDSLRHALDKLVASGWWRIEKDHETVRLDLATCWVDAFKSPERADLLLDSLYGVSSAFDQWLIGERARFENRWQGALEQELNELVAAKAAPDLRAGAARRLLNFVPTHEGAVRCLMAAFADLNDPAQAIREYERFRLVLSTNLGMPPSDSTARLYEAIRMTARARTSRAANALTPAASSTGGLRGHALLSAPPETAGTRETVLQPSIAVLPFKNLFAQTGHDHIAAGLTEDLVEGFSRVPSLFVISRLSTTAYVSQNRCLEEIGAALGVRYLLSGSLRTSGSRLRLIAELADVDTGLTLWISRFDESIGDLLDLQNYLAERVVASVAPRIRSAELKRLHRKRAEDYDAYELFLRAQEHMHSASRNIFESSQALFEAAIRREPYYATALSWLAYWHLLRVAQGWSTDASQDTARAEHFAARAAECDPTEPMAYAVQGHIAAYLHRDFDLAFSRFDAALELSPNNPRACLWSAYAQAWSNNGSAAVQQIDRAMALSPYDPLVCAYSAGAGLAYLAVGQYARSAEFALRCMRENHGYSAAYKLLICSLVLLGREDEARTSAHRLLSIEPAFTVEGFRARSPAGTGRLGELYCDAFERAGIPLSN